jgi:dienelactone hydrolase
MRAKMLFLFVVALLLTYGLEAAVKGQQVEYKAGGITMKGYVAYDDAIKGKRPGILVVPEWWGHNEYADQRARMLAELGYTALAMDPYGNGKIAATADEAGTLSGELMKNMDQTKARFQAAVDTLKANPTVDPNRIGAIGYCMGGGIVIGMAGQGVGDLKGVVSFHGHPSAPEGKGPVKTKILVEHGAADQFLKKEDLDKAIQDLKAAGADVRIDIYPNAQHSFTNPKADEYGKKFNLPLAYNKEADEKSWEAMKKFFKEVL